MRRLILLVVVLAALTGGYGWWWLEHGLQLSRPSVDLTIEPGMTPRAVAQTVQDAGVPVNATMLALWFRLSGQDRQIRAGSYEIESGLSARLLLRKLVRGEESLRAVTLVEGWTLAQVRAALAKAELLRADSAGLTPDQLMQAVGRPGVSAEGRFFPDTYTYAKGSSDIALLQRALRAMDRQLAATWQQRLPDTPLRTPDEALILASIVEKETGSPDDRSRIAGVFCNRLRLGMPLQTDPTVIYGLGASYDGRLHRKDLETDTPWNTYTRVGLPPTAIAMPGRAALHAAVRPASTSALYFVARGDGSSEFSDSLEAHNRAVNRYIRGNAS